MIDPASRGRGPSPATSPAPHFASAAHDLAPLWQAYCSLRSQGRWPPPPSATTELELPASQSSEEVNMPLGAWHPVQRRGLSPRRTGTETEPPRGQPDHSQRAPELGSESGLPHRGGVTSSAHPGSAWPHKRKRDKLSRTARRLARVTRAPRGLCWRPDIAKEPPTSPSPAHLTLTHVSSHVCTYAHTPTYTHSHGDAPTHVPRLSPGSRH